MQKNHRLIMMLIAIATLIASWLIPEWLNRSDSDVAIAADESVETETFAADIPVVSFQDSVLSPFATGSQTVTVSETALPDNLSEIYQLDSNTISSALSNQELRDSSITFGDILNATETDNPANESDLSNDDQSSINASSDNSSESVEDVVIADIVDTPNKQAAPALNNWYINASVFNVKSRADLMMERLESLDYLPKINEVIRRNTIFYQVQLGPFLTEREARAESQVLRDKTGFLGSIVRR